MTCAIETPPRRGTAAAPTTGRAARAAVLAMAALLSGLAAARSSDRDQPMEIEADRSSSVLTGEGEAVLAGNVRIDQGTLSIRAAEATVRQAAGEIRLVLLEGSPATLQQQADDGATTRAAARRIEYDLGSETVLLTGDVVVEQPRGVLRGERVSYDLKTERLDAGGDSGPIRMVIPPKATTPKATAPEQPATTGTDDG